MSQEQLQSNLSYFGMKLEKVFIMEDPFYYALLFQWEKHFHSLKKFQGND